MDKHGYVRDKSNVTYTFLLAALISSFFIFESTSWSSWSIMAVTAALLGVYIVKRQARLLFKVAPFHKHILLFVLYSFFTVIWSWSASVTVSRSVTVLFVFICMSIIYMIYDDSGSLNGYLKAIMISGVIISLYTLFFIGLDNLRLATAAGGRFEGDTFYASINSMGMWMAICTIVFAHRVANTKFRLWYLLGVLPISMIAIAQSRTALVQAIVGIILVLIFKARDSETVLKKIGNFLTGVLLLLVIFYGVTQLEIFSGLYDRMRSFFGLSALQKEGSIGLRNQMIEIGFVQFKKTPLFGIGFGSTHLLTQSQLGLYTYLHNNFVEILVSGGIIGFVIYYSMHGYILKNLWKVRHICDNNLQLCLILMLVHIMGDYGTVTFYKKPTYVLITLGYLAVAMARRREVENEG